MVVALVAMTASCDDHEDDLDELRDAAGEVLTSSGVTVQRQPDVQRSKDLEYVTADGTRPGDLDTVVEEVTTALTDDGWDVTTSEPARTAAGQTAPAHRVIAIRDDVAVQVFVAGTLGTIDAPAGSQWVQLSVAHPDDRLTWTTTAT